MARVDEVSHSFTCLSHVHPQPHLPSLSHSSSPPFGWYSISIPVRVGGRVHLGGWLRYQGGVPGGRWSPIPVVTGPSVEWLEWCDVST